MFVYSIPSHTGLHINGILHRKNQFPITRSKLHFCFHQVNEVLQGCYYKLLVYKFNFCLFDPRRNDYKRAFSGIMEKVDCRNIFICIKSFFEFFFKTYLKFSFYLLHLWRFQLSRSLSQKSC